MPATRCPSATFCTAGSAIVLGTNNPVDFDVDDGWYADFLAEQGLVERRGQRVILARNLLGTLRNRELAQAAKDIAAETGLEHRPVADGQRVAGIYRRSVKLASGRYAMLDDGMGFSLVPWRPVIEQRLGQQIAATIKDAGVSWDMGRGRGVSIG